MTKIGLLVLLCFIAARFIIMCIRQYRFLLDARSSIERDMEKLRRSLEFSTKHKYLAKMAIIIAFIISCFIVYFTIKGMGIIL